jgi:hypothetical protein
VKIYTSYFGNIRKIKNPVSIAISSPRWYTGPCYIKLAPSWGLVKGFKLKRVEDMDVAISLYRQEYTAKTLDKLDQNIVFDELSQIYSGDDVVLLCYETPGKFCHRHLVAEWFLKAGIDVLESM